MSQQFINITDMQSFILSAEYHYEKAPGWFTDWLDDLYIRLGENWGPITLDEIVTLDKLYENDTWMPEPLAVNTVYKLFDRLKRDTTGIISY